MKKIFWTSTVWIVLFGFFLLYMRWFDQPLAQWMVNFLIKWEENVAEEIIESEQPELTGFLMEEEIEIIETEEKFSSESQLDSNWGKLFEQLDRIEVLVDNDIDVVDNSEAQTAEDDIFDEFKVRYEQNKK